MKDYQNYENYRNFNKDNVFVVVVIILNRRWKVILSLKLVKDHSLSTHIVRGGFVKTSAVRWFRLLVRFGLRNQRLCKDTHKFGLALVALGHREPERKRQQRAILEGRSLLVLPYSSVF